MEINIIHHWTEKLKFITTWGNTKKTTLALSICCRLICFLGQSVFNLKPNLIEPLTAGLIDCLMVACYEMADQGRE